MKIRLIVLFCLLSTTLFARDYTRGCKGKWDQFLLTHNFPRDFRSLTYKCDLDLKEAINLVISKNQNSDYKQARYWLYNELDYQNGELCDVYSSMCVSHDGESYPNDKVINCEHTWPQSFGAVGVARADLHHLFTATPSMNSRRNNHPFCEPVTIIWEERGSALGKNENGQTCFMPPEKHRGNVARAMFYFATRYNFRVDQTQESFFKKWNIEDVAGEEDGLRNDRIENLQGNRNIFVDYPELIDFITDF